MKLYTLDTFYLNVSHAMVFVHSVNCQLNKWTKRHWADIKLPNTRLQITSKLHSMAAASGKPKKKKNIFHYLQLMQRAWVQFCQSWKRIETSAHSHDCFSYFEIKLAKWNFLVFLSFIDNFFFIFIYCFIIKYNQYKKIYM